MAGRENGEETSDDSSSEASNNKEDTNLEPDNDDFSENDSDGNQGVGQLQEVTTEETAGPSNGKEGALFSATVESAIETKRRKSNTTNTSKKQQSKVSETTGNLKWHQKDSFEEGQMNFIRTAEKAMESTEKEDPPKRESENNNRIFGMYVASEIQQLPDRYQKIARHHITNILFDVQTRIDQEQQFQAQSRPVQHRHFNQFRQEPHYETRSYPSRTMPFPQSPLRQLSSAQNQTMPPTQSAQANTLF